MQIHTVTDISDTDIFVFWPEESYPNTDNRYYLYPCRTLTLTLDSNLSLDSKVDSKVANNKCIVFLC